MALGDLTRDEVFSAMLNTTPLGREAFLEKDGYRPAWPVNRNLLSNSKGPFDFK
jgi:hypothetical protein